jgi:hypothetical protein
MWYFAAFEAVGLKCCNFRERCGPWMVRQTPHGGWATRQKTEFLAPGASLKSHVRLFQRRLTSAAQCDHFETYQ